MRERPDALTDARLISLHKADILALLSMRRPTAEMLRKRVARSTSAAVQLFRSTVLPGDPEGIWSGMCTPSTSPDSLPGPRPWWARLWTWPAQSLTFASLSNSAGAQRS